jgi:hypothetical protein
MTTIQKFAVKSKKEALIKIQGYEILRLVSQ